jgi:DNA polymerase-3 subunit gamma/tau
MSTTLYRKYRPQTFAEVVGQQPIVQTLTNALKHNRLGQAYLFTGPRGTGKTTTARLLAKAINCTDRQGAGSSRRSAAEADSSRRSFAEAEPCLKCAHCLAMAEGKSLDVIEIDAASNTGVDNIRELRETAKLPPSLAAFKIYIIDEVHMLSTGAFNALLKTLEEPPRHVIFILATTALHKVPDTIVSRCQRFDFSRFPLDKIVEKLTKIAKSEKVKIDDQALEMIALAAEGGMRDAESLLTQVIALEDKEVTAAEVASILGITEQQKVEQLTEHLADKDLRQSLLLINRLVENGSDLYVFSNSLLHYLRQMLLLSIDPKLANELSFELTKEQSKKMVDLAQKLTTKNILILLELFQTARKEIRSATLPQLPLEIAVVKFVSGPIVPTDMSSAPPSRPASPTPRPTAPNVKTASESEPSRPVASMASSSSAQAASVTASTVQEPQAAYDTQETAPETESAGFTMDDVRNRWHGVMDKAKELNASLALALLNCQPLRLEGSTIVLGVKFPFHKEKLNTAENRLTVEKAFDTILGAKTKVQVVVDESAAPAPQGASAMDNPLLAQAVSILGGQVVG